MYQCNAHSEIPIPPQIKRAVPAPAMARFAIVEPNDDDGLVLGDISCTLDCDRVSEDGGSWGRGDADVEEMTSAAHK